MADIFELDAETIATVENGIDSLIHQLGKDCKLIYEGEREQCPNCNFDPSTGRSSNVYNGVGPKPFRGGRCPVCHGTGFLPGGGTTEDIVRFLVDWQPKPWQFVDPSNTSLKFPMGAIQIKGFATDLPKVLQAKYFIVDYTNAVYSTNRFVLWSSPVITGNIARSRYFVAFLQKYQD